MRIVSKVKYLVMVFMADSGANCCTVHGRILIAPHQMQEDREPVLAAAVFEKFPLCKTLEVRDRRVAEVYCDSQPSAKPIIEGGPL